MSPMLNKLKELVHEVEEFMIKNADCGAADTEADSAMQWVMKKASQGNWVAMKPEMWQLYMNNKPWGERVANQLTIKAIDIRDHILEEMSNGDDADKQEMEEWIDEYCWRMR